MKKEVQRDYERYLDHIQVLERSIEILKGDEPRAIKRLMLSQMGTDAQTYGDVLQVDDLPYYIRQSSDLKHIWSIESELKSFRHAIRTMEESNG